MDMGKGLRFVPSSVLWCQRGTPALAGQQKHSNYRAPKSLTQKCLIASSLLVLYGEPPHSWNLMDIITYIRLYKYMYIYIHICVYIYTLGAGGSPKVLWVGYCECWKLLIRCGETWVFEEVTFYIEWCSARTKFFWSARWLMKNPSFMHLYLWETCDLCGKMTILEMSWWSKRSKVLWATVYLELVSQSTGRRSEFEHENKLQCLTVKPFGVVLCCVCDLVIISV